MMEYHRAQLKQSAKVAMARTRPRAGLVTFLFLLLCMTVTALFGFLAPAPFEGLGEHFSEALEEAVDYVSGTGDVDRALEEFEAVMDRELREEFMNYVGGRLMDGLDENAVTGFVFHLLAGSILAGLGAWLLSVMASLINVILDHGYRNYCLGVFRREDPSIGKLFSAFPRILTVLGSYIMVYIYTSLWSLLGIAVGGVLIFLAISVLPAEAAVIVSAILYLAAVLFIAAFALRYALTPYIVVEYRDMGVFESIRYSKELMKGNKLRLFILGLSFLGWILLVALLVSGILLVGVLLAALVISVTRMALLGAAAVGVAAIAAILVTFPLSLWLRTYQNVTLAGFYHIVSFPADEAETAPDETLVLEPVGAGIAAASDMPVWANAPEEEILPPREEEPTEEAISVEAAAEEEKQEEEAPPTEEPTEETPEEEAPFAEGPEEISEEGAPAKEENQE